MKNQADYLIETIGIAILNKNLYTHYDLIRWVKKGWVSSTDWSILWNIMSTYYGKGTQKFLYDLNSDEVRATLRPCVDRIREDMK